MKRLHLAAAAALAALVGLAVAPAFAAPNAHMLQDSNVRKTANPNSPVVNSVAAGQLVTVLDCQGTVCLIQIPGPDGWVRQNRLGGLGKGGKPASNVPFSFSFGVGGDGKPSISIGIGNQPKPQPLPEPEEEEEDQVCFYKNANFNGASFCVEPGDADDELSGSWDDSISSIEVFGNADVLVCRDYELEGICADISSSKASLPKQLNNAISSYEVN
ncbi:hypothetical protein VW23_012675 [Devosia insulae DS-56]|uniref:SH3b domain-containing protein n=1 Tax=Devosia insulae DS-56 TaxID=1116389 RepID=A0A1E5XUE7_9HYPH|nr:peptidase inhibitor family I36 protein [Devosia insulae]OEO32212.1 hypothetical protein VW23_012675 [Devosia insulae DS-56]